ncbi:hypothetical protein EON83_27940 [bacterium]|nr:MAG: hypothetical protein EON83_27940 [bacterium]
MNPLDSYLARINHELRSLPLEKRDEELRELRSHLEQRIEDFTGKGLSPEAAQTSALHEFGSPQTLGQTLCDVWENGPLSAKRLASAIARVSLFWLCTTFELICGISASAIWPETALFPELPYIVTFAALSIPIGCGWLWFSCLGKRRLQVPLLFAAITFNALFWGGCLAYLNSRPFPTAEPFYDSILALNPLLAAAGAYLARAFRQNPNHLALPSGQTLFIPFSLPQSWNFRAIYVCMALLIGLSTWRHIAATLHPTTPINTLRSSLLVEHNPTSLQNITTTPTVLYIHQLPATTPAEVAGREARVSFQLEAHAYEGATQYYANYLRGRLAVPNAHTPQLKARISQSIAELQRNNHPITGVVRLTKTPNGWRIDESSFDRSQLWSWYYAAISPYSPESAKPR